jgi:hypothetical protein
MLNFLYTKRKRIAQILGGHGLYAAVGWFFDNPLYIYVLAVYGPLLGGLVMIALSLVISAAFMIVYNHTKIDWLGINVIEKIKNGGRIWTQRLESRSVFIRIIAFIPVQVFHLIIWSLKKGDAIAFFVLSIFEDPFITTVYLRHGSFERIKSREWKIFLSSVVVSNGYWIARNTAIIEVFRYFWRAAVN